MEQQIRESRFSIHISYIPAARLSAVFIFVARPGDLDYDAAILGIPKPYSNYM